LFVKNPTIACLRICSQTFLNGRLGCKIFLLKKKKCILNKWYFPNIYIQNKFAGRFIKTGITEVNANTSQLSHRRESINSKILFVLNQVILKKKKIQN
jgi:hypothetical protein